jgi:hypothetical protein
MRDIREDLRQRLTMIAAQRGQLRAKLSWLDEAEAHIKGLLDYEHVQAEMEQPFLFDAFSEETERSPVAQFLRDALADLQPKTLDELKARALARGLDFKGKNPGRVLHFALVGMAQSGLAESLGSGSWRFNNQTRIANADLTM